MIQFYRRESSPIKDPELCLLNKEDVEKDDDEEFWMNTCNSFVVQLAETQEKKKVKTPIKRKLPKEQLPQPPKRKYTKRKKVEPISESEQENKVKDFKEDVLKKPTEEIKSEKFALQEKINHGDKSVKIESLDMDKENKTKEKDQEKTTDDKEKEDDEKATSKVKPKRKRLFKLKFPKPLLVTKVKKLKKEDKKELKMKKEEKKELKKGEKKETIKKDVSLLKTEKKELAAAAKEEKKGLKKEEKRDLKKDPQNKKDLNNKKENKKTDLTKKKMAAEKENVTKNNENTTRRSAAAAAAAAINEVASKFNPRQSLRRKNSLKDYSFAFDELLDDPFVHFETDEIPVKAAATVVVKKPKEKDNIESMRMKLRSRSRPLLVKQEPLLAAKKKANAKNKNIPKRRRKKSLGEKSAHPAVTTTDDWKDELYKFKRSLRLPSKLISVVSPPSAVGPDQVSLTSIMNIPPLLKPAKVPKTVKSASQSHAAVTSAVAVASTSAAGKNKTKRLGHLFGRRDVFKGRRLLKREKIVSAEKLMQRNLRKRRQQKDEGKKGCAGDEATADIPDDEDVNTEVDEDDDDDGKNGRKPPPARMMFKRKFMRKKFRSGFDYIKKKKKKEPASEKKSATSVSSTISTPPPKCAPRYVSEIQADIKVWIVNKGHGETVLHRAARLGVKVSILFSIDFVFANVIIFLFLPLIILNK
jgi:hypothetical protein